MMKFIRSPAVLWIALSTIIFTAVRISFFNFVPIWDGISVASCVLNSLIPKLVLFRLNCHHPSMGYLGLMALGQMLDLGNAQLLHTVNFLLAIFGLLSFAKIIQYLFKKEGNRGNSFYLETALMVLLLAFNPLFFAGSLSVNLDFATTIFFLLSVYGLMYGRPIFSIISLTFLIFTKEPALLLYVSLAIGYTIFFKREILFKKEKVIVKAKQLLEIGWYFVPLGLFVFYFEMQKLLHLTGGLWFSQATVRLILSRVWLSRIVVRFIQLGILNFHWIYSLTIIICLLRFIQGKNFKIILESVVNIFQLTPQKRWWIILIICGLMFSGPVMLVNTYTLPRYILPLIPLLILGAAYSLKHLITHVRLRILILTGILLLSFLQVFTSSDPISNYIFTTFNFGSRKMLRMTSLVGECCGYAGKDQLAYNSEFTVIDHLINQLYLEIPNNWQAPLFIGEQDAAINFLPFDIPTKQRTLRKTGIQFPTIFVIGDLPYFPECKLPDRAYYVYLPWSDQNAETALIKLEKYYLIGNLKIIDVRGYQISYYPLKKLESTCP